MKSKPLWAAGLSLACVSVMAQSAVTLSGTLDAGVRRVKNGSVGSMTSEVSKNCGRSRDGPARPRGIPRRRAPAVACAS